MSRVHEAGQKCEVTGEGEVVGGAGTVCLYGAGDRTTTSGSTCIILVQYFCACADCSSAVRFLLMCSKS